MKKVAAYAGLALGCILVMGFCFAQSLAYRFIESDLDETVQ